MAEPVTDLVEFLRVRLNDDAQAALDALHGGMGRWTPSDAEREPGRIEDERGNPVSYYEGAPTEAQADHIARHDPARVLREVEAKRRIIASCQEVINRDEHPMAKTLAVLVLEDMSLPYADHPDYREEWKP